MQDNKHTMSDEFSIRLSRQRGERVNTPSGASMENKSRRDICTANLLVVCAPIVMEQNDVETPLQISQGLRYPACFTGIGYQGTSRDAV